MVTTTKKKAKEKKVAKKIKIKKKIKTKTKENIKRKFSVLLSRRFNHTGLALVLAMSGYEERGASNLTHPSLSCSGGGD